MQFLRVKTLFDMHLISVQLHGEKNNTRPKTKADWMLLSRILMTTQGFQSQEKSS